MQPQLVKLSETLTVNVAHVAYAEDVDGQTVLHMALASAEFGRGGERVGSHPALVLTDEEAAAWRAAVEGVGHAG